MIKGQEQGIAQKLSGELIVRGSSHVKMNNRKDGRK
jgi:LacI family purine nucleotide synthesis repressor